jgi:L-amino acid N-acyltransferase YncA
MIPHVSARSGLILAALTLAMTGCAVQPMQPTGTPATEPTQPTSTPATATQATAAPATAQPEAEPTGFSGDAMIWPLVTDIRSTGGGDAAEAYIRYGFVTSGGTRIADQFLGYSYCLDASGKPTRLAAVDEKWSYLFDLSGEQIQDWEGGGNDVVECLDDRYVLSYQAGEGMFWNLQGYDLEAESPLEVDKTLRGAAIGAEGSAVLYEELRAELLHDSLAVAEINGETADPFRDREGRIAGYMANSVLDEHFALYNKDQQLIADNLASYAWCTATYCALPNGQLIDLATWESTPFPEGFTEIVTTYYLANAERTRIYSLLTDRAIDLPAGYQWAGFDDWFDVYGPMDYDTALVAGDGQGHLMILSPTGKQVYSEMKPVVKSSTSSVVVNTDYYFMSTPRWKGYVNPDGEWVYRENAHSTLEE